VICNFKSELLNVGRRSDDPRGCGLPALNCYASRDRGDSERLCVGFQAGIRYRVWGEVLRSPEGVGISFFQRAGREAILHALCF
jgi:hypothetical protein